MNLETHPNKSLKEFIKTVVEIKSKQEEDKLVVENLEKLKQDILNSQNSNSKKMEHVIKLLYSEMLGHNVQFGNFSIISMIESKKLEVKRLGYLAATLLLDNEP